MKIGFFEVRLFGLTRFPKWIAEEILNDPRNVGVEFVFFYDQDDVIDKQSVISSLPEGSKVVKVDPKSSKSLVKLLNSYQIDRLMVTAQRIPDSAVIACCKKLGIKTIMYQHGLYIPFMKREASLFYKNIIKTIRYALYAKIVGELSGESSIDTLRKFLNIFVFGKNYRQAGISLDKVNVDKVLVYGTHWKSYHNEQYGYLDSSQVVVGAPDFDGWPRVGLKPVSGEVCYVAQTLVEDGRLARPLMEDFLRKLSFAVRKSGLSLVIKLHPRSDMSLYEDFVEFAKFESSNFPQSHIYIGHYSSILSKATFVTDKICLIDFPGHDIPSYISLVANNRINYSDIDSLLEYLMNANSEDISQGVLNDNIQKQDHYFDSSVIKPIQAAAHEVLK
ncbi:hypothetical protein [Ferrimonas futtsuensis]|uniref:hypothetical protein n=1 Tax=Ferrimonas futtsuensis TaxID=364764 RepID=UPI000413A4C4|nr:hypothetical protein [Ferrimonas futtsuensis]